MGEHAAAVDVDLIADGHVVAEDGDVLEARPLADGALPADDGALDPCVVLNLRVLEQHAALQADAITDDHARADGHVGADAAVSANLGGGVDEDVAAVDVGLAGGGERLGAALGERGQVQAGAGQEVLGLTDVHPEALEVERVQVVVIDHGGEDLLLDGGGAELDTVEHRGVEDIHAGVDAVADELHGLLDKAVDQSGVAGLVDDDTILGGLLNLGDNDGALLAVVAVELRQVAEGEVADDVRVEDEEGLVVLAEGLLGELEGAGGVEGLGLDREGDVDAVLLLILRERVRGMLFSILKNGTYTNLAQARLHHLWPVVDGEHDIGDACLGESLDLVEDHGPVAELDQGLGKGEGLRKTTRR